MKKYTSRRCYKKKKFTRNKGYKLLSTILSDEITREINKEIIQIIVAKSKIMDM